MNKQLLEVLSKIKQSTIKSLYKRYENLNYLIESAPIYQLSRKKINPCIEAWINERDEIITYIIK